MRTISAFSLLTIEADMATAKPCVTTADELVRQFSHYSEIAQDAPVVITKNGHPQNVLISIEEYERLKTRDQQAFLAANTPEHFLAEIEALASGKDRWAFLRRKGRRSLATAISGGTKAQPGRKRVGKIARFWCSRLSVKEQFGTTQLLVLAITHTPRA